MKEEKWKKRLASEKYKHIKGTEAERKKQIKKLKKKKRKKQIKELEAKRRQGKLTTEDRERLKRKKRKETEQKENRKERKQKRPPCLLPFRRPTVTHPLGARPEGAPVLVTYYRLPFLVKKHRDVLQS